MSNGLADSIDPSGTKTTASVPSWVLTDSPAATPKGERTRRKILDAATYLIKHRSFQELTVAEIVGRSGVSTGSFYRYFPSREHLLVYLATKCFWEMYESVRGVWQPDRSSIGNIEATTETYLLAFSKRRQVLKSVVELSAVSPEVRERWWAMRRDLYALMKRRLVQDQALSDLQRLDSEIMIRCLAGMVDSYAQRLLADQEYGATTPSDIKEATTVLARIWHRAVFGSDRDNAR